MIKLQARVHGSAANGGPLVLTVLVALIPLASCRASQAGSAPPVQAEVPGVVEPTQRPRVGEIVADLTSARELARSQRYVEAAAAYRQVLLTAPEHGEALAELGWVLGQLGHVDEALEVLLKAVLKQPESARIHYEIAAAYAKKSNHSAALKAYEEAARLGLRDARTLSEMGLVLAYLGRHEEAIGAFEESLRMDAADTYTHNNLGGSLQELGRTREAIGHYREAIRLDPRHAKAHANLGVNLAAESEFEEAEPHLREAVRLDPTQPAAQYNWAGVLYQLGRFQEALAPARDAARLEPDNQAYAAGVERILRAIRDQAEGRAIVARSASANELRMILPFYSARSASDGSTASARLVGVRHPSRHIAAMAVM